MSAIVLASCLLFTLTFSMPSLAQQVEDHQLTAQQDRIIQDFQNSPEGKKYFRLIGEIIQRQGTRELNRLVNGEVQLNFTLTSDGKVKGKVLAQSLGKRDAYLEKMARLAVLHAAPFPGFPKPIDECAEINFNLVVAFAVEG